jgi:hypothetical protein
LAGGLASAAARAGIAADLSDVQLADVHVRCGATPD